MLQPYKATDVLTLKPRPFRNELNYPLLKHQLIGSNKLVF